MNFRILAAPVRTRGRVLALLAATALSATLLSPDVHAQQPAPAPAAPAPAAPKAKAPAPKAAAPKATPAAPAPTAQQAPPAGAPAAGAPQEPQIRLIYAPWTKFCLKVRMPTPSRFASPARTGGSSPASPSSPL